MADFTVEKGKRYQATITLGLLQSVASNEMVADQLREVGFTDVSVTGSGRMRIATGLWPGDTISTAIPSEISNISLLA